MKRVLIVGATGQLGMTILAMLLRQGTNCIAFVRDASEINKLFLEPIASGLLTVVEGSLSNLKSIRTACRLATHVIATASTIVPKPGDEFGAIEVTYYHNLLSACRERSIKQFVYISAFQVNLQWDATIPEFGIKRKIEKLILESGIPYTIFRSTAFMDIYFATMGSQSVVNGATKSTLLRGFWLTSLYERITRGLIEKWGFAIVPGNGKAVHPFICIKDVATFMINALELPYAQNKMFQIGGPANLSWIDVAQIYSENLGLKVKVLPIPIIVYLMLGRFLKPISPAAQNIMELLHFLGQLNYQIEMEKIANEFSVRLTRAEEFIQDKLKAL